MVLPYVVLCVGTIIIDIMRVFSSFPEALIGFECAINTTISRELSAKGNSINLSNVMYEDIIMRDLMSFKAVYTMCVFIYFFVFLVS